MDKRTDERIATDLLMRLETLITETEKAVSAAESGGDACPASHTIIGALIGVIGVVASPDPTILDAFRAAIRPVFLGAAAKEPSPS